MFYFYEIYAKLWFFVEILGQSFSWATSELSPPLTLGTLSQIHKEFKGSGYGLDLTSLGLT